MMSAACPAWMGGFLFLKGADAMECKYAMIAGLHSKKLASDVIGTMDVLDEIKALSQYKIENLLIRTTHTGDIDVYQAEHICCEAAYLFQEMDNEPWQDLAALCAAAQQLKKQGVKRVIAVVPVWKLGHHMSGIPYLSDRCGTQKIVADILKCSGLDRLATLTPTVDMLSGNYPIEVVQIDYSQKLAQILSESEVYQPVVLTDEEGVLPLAQSLAYRLGWNFGFCRIGKYETLSSEDVHDRDVLLYTHLYTDRLCNAAEDLLRRHCRSVSCYIPWFDNPEYTFDGLISLPLRLITAERDHAGPAIRLPVEEIVAGWILQDRSESCGHA